MTSAVATWPTSTNVIDMTAIKNAGLRIGADPLGGASVNYWSAIAKRYGLQRGRPGERRSPW